MRDDIAGRLLTDFELMFMLAVLRVREDTYGVTITREIDHTGRRPVTLAAVYLALDRLSENELVKWRLGESTPERGGRAIGDRQVRIDFCECAREHRLESQAKRWSPA